MHDSASPAPQLNTASDAERDNLLQIINGTTAMMEDIWSGDHGSAKYVTMLRASVQEAAAVTAQIVEQSRDAEPSSAPEEPEPLTPAKAKRRRPRILAVDDEPAALLMFRDLLSVAGYDVVSARSGFECLDLVGRDKTIDVVVLDLTMPFIDGEETFRHLRNVAPHLPVILTTAYIDASRLQALQKVGLFAFVRKPLAPDEFLEQIAAAVAGRRETLTFCGTAPAQ
jgi:CheY-like chemotaxis protein/sarcosine oxidase delta subunit